MSRGYSKSFSNIPVKPAKLANNEDSLLTREEAARLLKCSEQTVDAWSKKGHFKAYYLGVSVRYLKSEIIAAFVSPEV